MRIPRPRRATGPRRTTARRDRWRGPWRIAVAETSMVPALRDGDWLLIDPTVTRWPRRGAIVVFREPVGDALSVKRVAGRPGDRVPFETGFIELADDEAWLLSDASTTETAAAGHGEPIDSRRYGPVPVELLVGRAWFRYAPWRRVGRLPPPRDRGDAGVTVSAEGPPRR